MTDPQPPAGRVTTDLAKRVKDAIHALRNGGEDDPYVIPRSPAIIDDDDDGSTAVCVSDGCDFCTVPAFEGQPMLEEAHQIAGAGRLIADLWDQIEALEKELASKDQLLTKADGDYLRKRLAEAAAIVAERDALREQVQHLKDQVSAQVNIANAAVWDIDEVKAEREALREKLAEAEKRATDEKNRADAWVKWARDQARSMGVADEDSGGSIDDARTISYHAKEYTKCHVAKEQAEARAEKAEQENAELRTAYAICYAGVMLYTDDGELQDNRDFPAIDFKRDPWKVIQAKLGIRATAAAHRAKVQPPAEVAKPCTFCNDKGFPVFGCSTCGKESKPAEQAGES